MIPPRSVAVSTSTLLGLMSRWDDSQLVDPGENLGEMSSYVQTLFEPERIGADYRRHRVPTEVFQDQRRTAAPEFESHEPRHAVHN